jgi:hypothetical protein
MYEGIVIRGHLKWSGVGFTKPTRLENDNSGGVLIARDAASMHHSRATARLHRPVHCTVQLARSLSRHEEHPLVLLAVLLARRERPPRARGGVRLHRHLYRRRCGGKDTRPRCTGHKPGMALKRQNRSNQNLKRGVTSSSPPPPPPSPPPPPPPPPSPPPLQQLPVECGRPGLCPNEAPGLRDPDELHEVNAPAYTVLPCRRRVRSIVVLVQARHAPSPVHRCAAAPTSSSLQPGVLLGVAALCGERPKQAG